MNSKNKNQVLFGAAAAFIFATAFICGCYNDPLDPTQIGRFEPTPKVNVILDNLGVAEEPSPTYEWTEEPRPEDLIDYQADYSIGSGDVVQISIFELYQEGQVYVNNYIVTESGRISIPDVGLVQAAGLTEPTFGAGDQVSPVSEYPEKSHLWPPLWSIRKSNIFQL